MRAPSVRVFECMCAKIGLIDADRRDDVVAAPLSVSPSPRGARPSERGPGDARETVTRAFVSTRREKTRERAFERGEAGRVAATRERRNRSRG